MRLASIRYQGRERVGLLEADRTLRLGDFASMAEVIARGSRNTRVFGSGMSLNDVDEWLPPVPRPGKILGVAMNNSASNERKISAPDHPAYF